MWRTHSGLVLSVRDIAFLPEPAARNPGPSGTGG